MAGDLGYASGQGVTLSANGKMYGFIGDGVKNQVAGPYAYQGGAVGGLRIGEIVENAGGNALRTEIRNGYTYKVDELNRTVRVEGELVSNSAQGRNTQAQLQAGGVDRLLTDEGGHFVGRRFDGPVDDFNHFAQNINFNRGVYKALENSWQRALDGGSSVNVGITPKYLEDSFRPHSLDLSYTIDGVPFRKTFFNRSSRK